MLGRLVEHRVAVDREPELLRRGQPHLVPLAAGDLRHADAAILLAVAALAVVILAEAADQDRLGLLGGGRPDLDLVRRPGTGGCEGKRYNDMRTHAFLSHEATGARGGGS